MYNTHAHTILYTKAKAQMLEDHNHCYSPRVQKCDSFFDFSNSMHTLSKIIITAPLIYFSISLCLSLILDITSPLHTLHGYVMQCTLCPKVLGVHWCSLCFLIPPEITAIWIHVAQSDFTCFASLHSNSKYWYTGHRCQLCMLDVKAKECWLCKKMISVSEGQDQVRVTFFAESVNKSAGKCMAVYGTRWLCLGGCVRESKAKI